MDSRIFSVPTFKTDLSRRNLLMAGAALGAGVGAYGVLGGPTRAFAQGGPVGSGENGKVIIRTPGGAYEEAWRAVCWEPFARETGIQVIPFATNAAKIMAMLETGVAEVDVLDYGPIQFNTLAEHDALVPLDRSRFTRTNLDDVTPVEEYYVGAIVYSTVLAYNAEAFSEGHPSSWAQFWDTQSFPGPRMLADMATGLVDLEFALLADGVAMQDLYPLDVDRAFNKLREIRPDIVKWWDTGAIASQMLADRQAVAGSIWNGRAQTLMEKGAPIAIEWNEAQRHTQGLAILKDSPRIDNAYKLIDYSLQPKVQAELVKRIAYGPANVKSFDHIPEELASNMPTSPKNMARSFANDALWWSENGDMVAERWQEFLLER